MGWFSIARFFVLLTLTIGAYLHLSNLIFGFNDVWRSKDGGDWELVTPGAGWSARPGHQCVLLSNRIACFGGYGEPQNPDDIWVSGDGKEWEELGAPASPPWNAATPDDVKYDFDALVVRGCRSGLAPSIMTFGGDRERFEPPPEVNATRVDNGCLAHEPAALTSATRFAWVSGRKTTAFLTTGNSSNRFPFPTPSRPSGSSSPRRNSPGQPGSPQAQLLESGW